MLATEGDAAGCRPKKSGGPTNEDSGLNQRKLQQDVKLQCLL